MTHGHINFEGLEPETPPHHRPGSGDDKGVAEPETPPHHRPWDGEKKEEKAPENE